jgi:hypothetical protein
MMSETYRRGLSPRVRGNPGWDLDAAIDARSIPACAGEPPLSICRCPRPGVYPRVCGGTPDRMPAFRNLYGLSPRVRGNHGQARLDLEARRSIPACAGEPRLGPGRGDRREVYPRVCGGTAAEHLPLPPAGGLSPRVRGNPRKASRGQARPGSIPACAGEPPRRGGHPAARGVYPRVCGGTVACDDMT